MILKGKNAIIYGGGGSIGGAMARAFAREGARVFLAGRTAATLDRVADDIRAAGGRAETAVLDALDERAVDEHADAVAAEAGSLDISVNVITHGDVQGTPIDEMDVEDYLRPVTTAVRTTFLTVRAAARHMKRQGGGVILAFGGEGDPPRGYHLGGLQTAFQALEAMRRQVSTELAGHGVRFVSLRSGGVAESIPEDYPGGDQIRAALDEATLLGRTVTLDEVGDIAAFVASDRARTMTAATVNVSSGALMD
jgi:NAD(P)-dependent dehydrogenase (short-subunit alcohol dehydrogenase family)